MVYAHVKPEGTGLFRFLAMDLCQGMGAVCKNGHAVIWQVVSEELGGREMNMSHLFLLYDEHSSVVLKDIRMKQVHHVLRTAISVA